MKKYMADHKIKFYVIDGVKIGEQTGMGPRRINTILQAAFFKLSKIIPEEKAIKLMKEAVQKTYGHKGEDIVKMNCAAIDEGSKGVVEVKVPKEWSKLKASALKSTIQNTGSKEAVKFVKNIQSMINAQRGNELPVSAFVDYQTGIYPSGTAAFWGTCQLLLVCYNMYDDIHEA